MKSTYSKTFVISIVAICVLNIAVFGWFHALKRIDRGKENVKTPLCKDCNIVLVTMDVCSSRNMPCYGYGRDTTPNLCAFASENQLFLNSFASAPWTYPSHASLMTGLLPTHHGVNIQYQDSLSPTIPLLYEELQQNGYETILFQNKESDVTPLDTVYNRGVSVVDESFNVDRIFSRIKENTQAGKKSFISYYMAQCHEPNMVGSQTKVYTTDSYPNIPIEENSNLFVFTPESFAYLKKKLPDRLKAYAFKSETPRIKDLFERMVASNSFEKAKALFLKDSVLSSPELIGQLYWSYIYESYIDVNDKKMMAYLQALYDQDLQEQDASQIRKILENLKESAQKNNTIVLITSQHGQEFGEHGVFGHTTLYEGNARVPFILSVPGIPPHVFSEPVSGVDIMPTLLDLVGIQSNHTYDGLSIAPLLRGEKLPNRLIIAEQDAGEIRTIRKGNWKLFIQVFEGAMTPYELYDVAKDPLESKNLLASHFDLANTILQEYKQQYGIKKVNE